MTALPAPTPVTVLTQWGWQPLAIVASILVCVWYARSVRAFSRSGERWPIRSSVLFGGGIALELLVCCGFLQAYGSSLYWAWTSQMLALFLGVPVLLLLGRPLQLAMAIDSDGWLPRALRTRPVRVLAQPLVGPVVFPVLAGVLFFSPLPAWMIQVPAASWVLQLLLLILGSIVLLPLIGPEDSVTSLGVASVLMFGMIELILDAIPGIVLRLHRSLVTPYFDHISLHTWTPSHLHDQQTAGTVLWVVAEVIDLPFLLVVFRRWLRADARDAAQIDAVLDAERAARGGNDPSDTPLMPGSTTVGPADSPWWLRDSHPS